MYKGHEKKFTKGVVLACASFILIVYGWSQKLSRLFVGTDTVFENGEQCTPDETATEPSEEDREGLFVSCGGFF